jgi:hypothetical protein
VLVPCRFLHQIDYPNLREKCIKSCAGEVKNVTKLKSGGLMIECQRKQQSLNLLSLNFYYERKLRTGAGSPNETTVRNINYLIDPLATAFFNDPFS